MSINERYVIVGIDFGHQVWVYICHMDLIGVDVDKKNYDRNVFDDNNNVLNFRPKYKEYLKEKGDNYVSLF